VTTGLVSFLLGLLVTALAAAAIFYVLWRRRRHEPASQVTIHSTIEQLRSIGHLSAFKVITKEIVTETDHSWGTFGSKYLSWVLSKKKMAMIFEFAIDFRYDLRRPDFTITTRGPNAYTIQMPTCQYEVQIRDIQFYDEQHAKLLPWLLPDLLSGFLMDGFSEEHRNKLLSAARRHAEQQAIELIGNYESEVQRSARSTLRSISRAFGAEEIEFEFGDTGTPALIVEYDRAAS